MPRPDVDFALPEAGRAVAECAYPLSLGIGPSTTFGEESPIGLVRVGVLKSITDQCAGNRTEGVGRVVDLATARPLADDLAIHSVEAAFHCHVTPPRGSRCRPKGASSPNGRPILVVCDPAERLCLGPTDQLGVAVHETDA